MTVTMSDIGKAVGASESAINAASSWQSRLKTWGDLYAQTDVEVRFDLASGTYARPRATLGMGKRTPEDWAGLCWTEKASVTAGEPDSPTAVFLDGHFGETFAPRFGTFLESQNFARGTGALEVRIEGIKVGAAGQTAARLSVATVPANCILFREWDDEDVTALTVVNITANHIDVRTHSGDETMRIIESSRFDNNNGNLGARWTDDRLIEAGIAPMVGIRNAPRLFAIVRPQIANNLDESSPYGVSVFANAGSQLNAVDEAWDSLQTEIRLTRAMVGIPSTMLREDPNNPGHAIPPQHDRKDMFFAMQDASGESKHGIWNYNPPIRVEALGAALDIALTSLSTAVGLGEERYRYRGETVATATQVISENSEAFRNRAKHLLPITHALTDIARAMLWLQRNFIGGTSIEADAEITVRTDDSIIEDDATVQTRGMAKVAAGTMSLMRYLMECEGMNEEAAAVEVGRITGENTGGELFTEE